eukprot:TRINITY_DN41528_c0_g1_i1.p1 TRINITY_DN41528_c0_g1~~TRINITY_DN41528_c0_g1_i1.p1  ORF type:complete len:257 (-),score=71.48 TRINITY_DN41528_c0_g1_i1:117-887(-)
MSSELSDFNKAQVQRFISYFKGKRERLISEREAEKEEFKSDRLSDDQAIFTAAEVADLLDQYHAQVVGTVREALEGFVNLSAVYTGQVLSRAEQSGVTFEADVAAIEDGHRLDEIAQLAVSGIVPPALSKRGTLASLGVPAPPSPMGGAAPPDMASAARLQELEAENETMRERYQQMQAQVADLLRERSSLAAQLESAGAVPELPEHLGDSMQFKEMKAIVRKKTDEVKMLKSYIQSAGLEIPGTEGGVELVADDD